MLLARSGSGNRRRVNRLENQDLGVSQVVVGKNPGPGPRSQTSAAERFRARAKLLLARCTSRRFWSRCRTASETGERAILGAQKWSGRISVSGEADWGGQNPHSDSAERPKRATLPPQRGQGDLRLTRHDRRHLFFAEGEAQIGNSG